MPPCKLAQTISQQAVTISHNNFKNFFLLRSQAFDSSDDGCRITAPKRGAHPSPVVDLPAASIAISATKAVVMSVTTLYDLLKSLSEAGREIAAQQQGSAGQGGPRVTICEINPQDIAVVKSFAEYAAAQNSLWQGMPQAGISLTDVTRCEHLYCTPVNYAAWLWTTHVHAGQILQVIEPRYVTRHTTLWRASCSDIFLPAQGPWLPGNCSRHDHHLTCATHLDTTLW